MRSLPTDKHALRQHLKALRDGISPESREDGSRAIVRALSELPQYRDCKALLLYAPIRSEVDLLPLAELALTQGKVVAFPVSHTEDCTLTFHKITEWSQLRTGAFGIREPDISLPSVTDDSEALCLVPALAYDRFGYRLGYGKGFYDRYLDRFGGISIGICFGDCLCDRLPHHPHDRRVDLIVTEGGVRKPDDETV